MGFDAGRNSKNLVRASICETAVFKISRAMQITFDSRIARRVHLLRERKTLRPHRAQQFRAGLHAVRQRQPPLRSLILFGGVYPQLKLRAILGCPCGTKPSRRKPRVEKLERFVKFKPQTPLREIIRLTAG
jgi:hypothetical protein